MFMHRHTLDLLSVPCGLMGSFLFAWLFGLENNIYMQTGLIMIIGLLAKTAILHYQILMPYPRHNAVNVPDTYCGPYTMRGPLGLQKYFLLILHY